MSMGSLAATPSRPCENSASHMRRGQNPRNFGLSDRAEAILSHIATTSVAISLKYSTFHTVCIVKDYIRERERRGREMFVPLTHPPGHAQADFGAATVIIGGVEQKAHFFAFDLPHSDACYIMAYPAATSEAWVDGHVHAFAFFGRVPVSVLYDNDRCLVASILPDGTRKRAKLFSGFLSHYLIRDRYGRPGKGNDKGGVEGLVGYARRNFMVPLSCM